MQIPQENTYTGFADTRNTDIELVNLSKDYTIHDKKEMLNFMEKHSDIPVYIREITPLINEYFPKYRKNIRFCKDPEFNDLDYIMIYIECSDYKKDKKTLEKLKNESLYLSKFSKKINGKVCLELW